MKNKKGITKDLKLIHNLIKISKILLKNNPYSRNKKMINSFFNIENNLKNRDEIIRARIVLIDSCYSTNINSKRHYGIDDLQFFLQGFANDKNLQNKLFKFLSNPKDDECKILFKKKFGKSKDGADKGAANSFLTKYYFFISRKQFPIYDSLVRITYGKLTKKYNLKSIPSYPNKNTKSKDKHNHLLGYFIRLKELKEILKLKSYDDLDIFLWLGGKIIKENYNLLFNKNSNYIIPNELKKFWLQFK